jgi:DNA-directed RNA polymerase subunit F
LDREEVKALFNEERVEISRKELSTIMEVASGNVAAV